MLKKRSTKLTCLLIAFVWMTVIIGSSYAYFIDSVSVTGNVVTSGNLKAELSWKNPGDTDWKDASEGAIFNYQRWEPGYTDVKYIKVDNTGSLAFQYELNVYPAELLTGRANLLEVIDVYYGEGVQNVTRANYAAELTRVGTLMDLLTNANGAAYGILLPKNGSKNAELPAGVKASTGSVEACMVLHMQETAGNEYQNLTVGDGFKVQLYATQYMYENDSFGNTYDKEAESMLPELNIPTSMVIEVQPVNGLVPYDVWFNDPTNGVSATVPKGAKMAYGATALKLVVEAKKSSEAKVNVTDDEELFAYNVKVEGLADDNTVPVVINMGEVLPNGLNLGNYSLYHVENGNTVKMTLVNSAADLDAHNEFTYDPVNGEVAVAMATFSEVTCVVDAAKEWKGEFDYKWYDADATELTIANADQLAAFGAIVGGMDGQTQDSFSGKTVKLVADVNLADKESENNPDLIFYPIGYYNSEGTYKRTSENAITSGFKNFEGTFDGNGHTIGNIYQNTWEMKGDNNYYEAKLQYYRDGMGLFGKVYGGTVKNLTVDHFSSDGEYTTTGVIAAYADGATFENIAITNCNPRVYNTGNGGIVGCVGWYAKEAGLKTTFTNITVDNTNKISALWGSWDVACGGLVGQYYPTSGQSAANAGVHFENCHVSAQIDVYNDVCANYQYYAYRYAGMMIGSIRENETKDGHVYPKMDGITASGCTVHFGTWNDYYYCELVDNTTASYTHDYQMSRLVEIKAIDGTTITYLDGTTGTVPASGRANYVIVDYAKGHGTANATCYHFKDGAVWTHDMGGIQEGIDENGDGATDLKEDKQHLYLEFNNLFTGYGWGVTSKGLKDMEGITILDITSGDHEESVEKFNGKVTELKNNTAIKLGDIFTFVDKGVDLVPSALIVTVTNLDENNPVSAEIEYNTGNWENGTLTLTGTGKVTITIQDYYFCKPTTITVNITERQPAEKFEVVMNNGDFLHRVGNRGTVALNKLFEAKDDVTVGTVSVTIEAVDGTGASGTYSNNAIQFSGTGVVKVTIKDDDTYCIPTVLYLEVVDATNVTSAKGTTTGGDMVLLCDVNASSYVYYYNCTLYGNGFTYSLNGAPTAYNSKQGHGILITQNATLDNLVIVGDTYAGFGAYTENDYYNTAVDVQGATIIQNCYIANCAAPVKARGDVTIKDSTLYGGAVANLIIMSGTVTLDNVTTANFDDGRELVGLGIVVHRDATGTAKLVLNGTLTQYNFISEDKAPEDKYAQEFYAAMFSDACSKYHFGTEPNRFVNTGIISLADSFRKDDISGEVAGYADSVVTVDIGTCFVYTQPKSVGSVNNNYDEANDQHKSKVQGDYLPTPVFTLGEQEVAGEDRYLKGDINGVEVRYIKGETALTLDITKLMTVYKYEGTSYQVKAECKDSNDTVIATNGVVTFNTAGSYTLAFTVEDNLFYNADGTNSGKSVTRTYEVPVNVVIAEPSIKDAVITVNKTALDGEYNESYGDRSYKFNPLDAITITDAEGTVNLTTNIASTNIVYASSSSAFAGATTITVTYNDGRELKIVLGKPSLNSPGASKVITYANDGTIKSAAKVASKSATGGTWTVTSYSFKGTNGKTVANNTVVTFTFPDKSCVTADTLVTLADGSKKEIQHVTYEDQLLVWNFFTGAYDVAPSSIIFYHGHELFDVMSLKFDDGTTVKTIHNHGFYDVEENKFVIIDEENAASYLGHSFIKVDGEQYKAVKLVDYSVEEEYTGCYSIQTAQHNNFMVEDMFSITKPAYEGWFDYFEIGDNLKYDEAKMQADIEKYGLYTYEEFAEYVTYEQFMAFSGPYLKVLVGRGVVTFEDILNLINTYVK